MIVNMCFRPLLLTVFMALLGAVAVAQPGHADALSLSFSPAQKGLVISHQISDGVHTFVVDGDVVPMSFSDGQAFVPHSLTPAGTLVSLKTPSDRLHLFHVSAKKNGQARIVSIPLWLSILPPLIAITLALIFKEVLTSLFVGIWTGAFIIGGLRIDSLYYFLQSFFKVIEKYIVQALTDSAHLSIIIFSLLIGGMVGIISRNGGMAGVVKSLSKYARSPASTQFITWLLGVAIFFDDYANTLIVGNTMRPVTDRFRISREKLAYIVDSTAAPIAAVAFITTWIGAELSYIDGGWAKIEDIPYQMTPYSVFISSLKYSFYPVLTLVFILLLIKMKREYGPMHSAEVRARTTGQVSSAATPDEDEPNMEDLSPVPGAPLKWQHAFFPVMTVILMTIFGLYSTGMDALAGELSAIGAGQTNTWSALWSEMGLLFTGDDPGFFRKIGKLIGIADSYTALLWASLSGVIVAIGITLWNRIMRVIDTMHTMVTGFKTMMPALLILALAWSLAITTEELETAHYLTSVLKGAINPYMMPALIFVLSAVTAFSTGSSWSTMAILYPIAIPTTWAIAQAGGVPDPVSLELLLNVISIVLGASVLGDHCSPISDTTILSSLASDCNHIDHVRTQLPYAITVGIVSLVGGTLSTFLGGGWAISFAILLGGVAALYLVISRVGKPVPLAPA